MAGPLLETKLHVPRRRRGAVPRPRLTERLDRGAEAALTLVSAPAGFGKTTMLTEWLAGVQAGGRPVAWLSLDRRDDDPATFWRYVLAALDTAVPGAVAGAHSLLESAGAPLDGVLATLLNELSAVPHDVVLVLDDHHLVDAREVRDGLAYLVEHLPAQVQLVLSGRADPALPLARLRGRGELVEVRGADLRFTSDEAAAYLTGAMGLALTADDVAALEGRTEGWIAALQLAALSLQGRDDAAGFIAGFAGDDRYVVDYLVEEVLQRQPAVVRGFLLETSVLSRLTGPLCDAVTGRTGSRTVLEDLDRGNLFLVPLDDRRRWYRYHHLFGDVLHARLLDEQPAAVAGLHRRASAWHEQQGDPAEAIGHALAAGDLARAADLVERAVPAMRQARQEATLRRWLEALPEELFADRPLLSLAAAGALLSAGHPAGVDPRLRDAERWLDAQGRAADAAEQRTVRGGIAVYRAAQARMRGDVAGTVAHARRVLDLVGEDAHLERGAAAGLLGLATWTTGDLEAASRWWSQAVADLAAAGHHADTLGGALALADIEIAQGRLTAAMGTYERGLRTATAPGSPVLRGAADMHVGLSAVLRERDDLTAARAHLQASAELGEHLGLPQNRHRWLVAMARLREAEGDPAGALELLDDAEDAYVADMFPDVQPIAALRARVEAAHGEPARALDRLRRRGLSVEDDLTYLREYEHVTLARVLLAEHRTGGAPRSRVAATRLLERLARAAEAGGRTGSLIEVLVLQALGHQAGDDVPAAIAALRRALTLAEAEGHVRVFADEGAALGPLLRAVARDGAAGSHAARLLTALAGTGDGGRARQGLVDPLSARELDVLRLLGSDLDGPAIARELFVSVNTVRTHTKAVYAKLGVNNRRAAVRRAAELGL